MPDRSPDSLVDPGTVDRFRDFSISVPEFYNFGYNVVDEWAAREPGRMALLWVNQQGKEKRYSFSDIKRESDRGCTYPA